jgi:glycerol-3-phosphate acyltransferase PlsY
VLAVLAAKHFFPDHPWIIVGAGFLAIIGHTFSPFLGFHGGKGVATSLGVTIALSWKASLAAFVVWLAIVLGTGFVSLASIVATPVGAVMIWLLNGKQIAYALFGAIVTIFVITKHRANISRLLRGEELKMTHKKKDQE